ncbi:MAG: C25 family cysteine peptidase [Salinivirgaceae bacterium]
MRNVLLIICIAAFTAVNAQQLSFEYDFSAYRVHDIDEHCIVHIDKTKNMAAPGDPLQPYQLSNVVLPQGTKLANVTVEVLEKQSKQLQRDVMPMQHVRPLSVSGIAEFVKNENTYKKQLVKSISQSIVVNTELMNGYSIAQVKFSPMEYNAKDRKVTMATKIRIVIDYAPSEKHAGAMVSKRPQVLARLQSLCINPEMAKTYQPKIDKSTNAIDALIITPEQFHEQFEPLRNDYKARGLSVETLSVNQIEQSYSGSDLQEKIRNAIIDYYQNHDVLYVLLGGDVEHIPHRGFYCSVQSSSVYEDDDIPSDLYYMALDGSWNDNGNDLWGEPDEDDLLPEVALSRMPFSTADELQNMLYKSLQNTNAPVVGELTAPLLAGEHLYDEPLTWGAQYLDLIHGTHDDNGYTTTGIPDEHPFVTMYDRDSEWSADELMNEINSGHPFIHHVGHSNSNYAMRLYNGDITTSNFEQTDGVTHNFPVIYTHGCICGAFDDSDCIAEHMLQIDRFAVAFVGNSRYGWFNEGQTEGPSQHLHREFVNALYADKIPQLAEAHLMSKLQTAGWVEAPEQHEYGAIRWVFYDCNALGEPALPIWTNEPQSIDVEIAQAVTFGQNQMSVIASQNGDPTSNITVAVLQNNQLLGSAITDAEGLANVSFQEGLVNNADLNIIFSGYNTLKDTIVQPIGAPEEGYLVVSDLLFGNDDAPVYGKTYNSSIIIQNVGQHTTSEAQLVISCTHPLVQMNDSSVTIPAMDGLEQATLQETISIGVSDTISDGERIEFQFEFTTDGEVTHSMTKTYEVQAPDLFLADLYVNDADAGNGNGFMDPGEVVLLTLELGNRGAVAPQNIETELQFEHQQVNAFMQSLAEYRVDEVTGHFIFEFPLQVMSVVENANFDVSIDVNIDFYQTVTHEYRTVIGEVIEDFESGDFLQFEWQMADEVPWEITANEVFEGEFSARSGNIDDGGTTGMSVSMSVPEDDSISFMYKVSCEEASGSTLWDYLEFLIDDEQIETWDGETDWVRASFPVSAGNHTFEWRYSKDYSVSHGDDCAWIDNIRFPIVGTVPPAGNSAPEVSCNTTIELQNGIPFNFEVSATDADNDSLSASLMKNPDWMHIENVGDNRWNITGTPPVDYLPNSHVFVAVSDGYESGVAMVEIHWVGIGMEAEHETPILTIYPQPAQNSMYIHSHTNALIQQVALISLNGQTLVEQKVGDTERAVLDVSAVQPGIYIVQITRKNTETVYRKVIVR